MRRGAFDLAHLTLATRQQARAFRANRAEGYEPAHAALEEALGLASQLAAPQLVVRLIGARLPRHIEMTQTLLARAAGLSEVAF